MLNKTLNTMLKDDIANISIWNAVSKSKVILCLDTISEAVIIKRKLQKRYKVKIERDPKLHEWQVIIYG